MGALEVWGWGELAGLLEPDGRFACLEVGSESELGGVAAWALGTGSAGNTAIQHSGGHHDANVRGCRCGCGCGTYVVRSDMDISCTNSTTVAVRGG